jgi:nitrogen fixation protein NifB
MNMMRHCRQCRADAVGLLGEDRGTEFTMDKVEAMEMDEAFLAEAMAKRKALREQIAAENEAKKQKAHAPQPAGVAVVTIHRRTATTDSLQGRPVLMAVAAKNGMVAEHFGHAREFLVYEATAAGAKLIGHRKTDLYCDGGDTCGDGESVLAKTIKALEGCEAVLCSKIGYEPWGELEAAGIRPNGEHAMEPVEEAVMAVWHEMLAAGLLNAPVATEAKRCA